MAEAITSAVADWTAGAPDNPEAWLLTAARNNARDQLRRAATLRRKLPLLVLEAPGVALTAGPESEPDPPRFAGAAAGAAIADERLRLICLCVHPALSDAAAVALTLRLVIGLSTSQIARLFCVSEPTMAARLTRTKKKIRTARIPYRLPGTSDLAARLARVNRVAFLLFTEGYAASDGTDLLRVPAAAEAIRLQRLVASLAEDDSETRALLALMLCQHARRDARVDAAGELVLLPDQDRRRWHRAEIDEGIEALRAAVARCQVIGAEPGPYAIQAAIAAEHAVATAAADTDWPAIAELYRRLELGAPSPVVRLHRAVAVAEAVGPAAGLALLADLDAALPGHHLVPATQAELARRLGRNDEAALGYRKALDLVGSEPERRFLARRLAEVTGVTAVTERSGLESRDRA